MAEVALLSDRLENLSCKIIIKQMIQVAVLVWPIMD